MAGDFNLNVLDFENNKKVQNFVNLMFRYGMKPNHKQTHASNVKYGNCHQPYHNAIIDTDFKTGILKSYISNHFAIMLAFQIG